MSTAMIAKTLAAAAVDYARNWAKKEAKIRGLWVGCPPEMLPVSPEAAVQAGYREDQVCRLFIEAAVNPLHFKYKTGCSFKADYPIISDGRSGLLLLNDLPKDYFDLEPFGVHLPSWGFHDAAYARRGCWWRANDDSEWLWLTLTRKQADMLLFQMLPATGGKNLEVRAVYAAVRAFGGKAWKRHRERERQTT